MLGRRAQVQTLSSVHSGKKGREFEVPFLWRSPSWDSLLSEITHSAEEHTIQLGELTRWDAEKQTFLPNSVFTFSHQVAVDTNVTQRF